MSRLYESPTQSDIVEKSYPNFDSPTRVGTNPSSCDCSLTEPSDNDEYTLSAFGDISLTNAYFIPGIPSEVPPDQPSVESKFTALADRPLPSVIQRILPPSPSKAILSAEEDFQRLYQNMKGYRTPISKDSSSPIQWAAKSDDTPNVTSRVHIVRHGLGPQVPTTRAAVIPPPPAPIVIPKPKDRPLRGYAKLPRRPPLPRWDLRDPDVYNKAAVDPQSLLGNIPTRLRRV